jgi:PemK-like, MazF-like toxin of type II toxin-antitoxin system
LALPKPETGLVINYAYLWHDEYLEGREEGKKNRPAVILLCVKNEEDGTTLVTVLAITHAPPKNQNDAIEIPSPIKKHLKLDDQRSWIVISEGNEFIWPGYDLRKLRESESYDYGFLPPKFFYQIRDAFVKLARHGKAKKTAR